MKPVLCIAGPTASGKSHFALDLAEAVGGEIVNSDALQVYEDIHILSARPSMKDLMRIPHHLYGYVSGHIHYSGGQWVRAVVPVVLDILARGQVPILVGGTGLYFKSLLDGLAFVPEIPARYIENIEDRISNEGFDAVFDEAEKKDPVGTLRLLGQDPQRLIRLLSVYDYTGRPLHEWQSATRPEIPSAMTLSYRLMPPRDTLYTRINERFESMVEKGGLEEAERIFETYGAESKAPMMKAIGLSHLLKYCNGDWSLQEAIDFAKRDTRRFAKRQMTWFRNQCPDWQCIEHLDIGPIAKNVKQWSA